MVCQVAEITSFWSEKLIHAHLFDRIGDVAVIFSLKCREETAREKLLLGGFIFIDVWCRVVEYVRCVDVVESVAVFWHEESQLESAVGGSHEFAKLLGLHSPAVIVRTLEKLCADFLLVVAEKIVLVVCEREVVAIHVPNLAEVDYVHEQDCGIRVVLKRRFEQSVGLVGDVGGEKFVYIGGAEIHLQKVGVAIIVESLDSVVLHLVGQFVAHPKGVDALDEVFDIAVVVPAEGLIEGVAECADVGVEFVVGNTHCIKEFLTGVAVGTFCRHCQRHED